MIQVTNLSLNFGARQIFDSVTFTLKPGEKVGLVGRNGCGKSTMLKMFNGDLTPDGGQIDMPNDYRLGYLAQTVDFDDTKTPREICSGAFSAILTVEQDLEEVQRKLEESSDPEEQMALSETLGTLFERLQLVGASDMSEEIERVLKGMGFQPVQFDRPVSELSGGWKMRVELARLLLLKPDLLLLDEPTNHLDIESIIWFVTHLQTYEGTVMIVSHDQHVLNRATSRTIEVTPFMLYDIPFPYHKAMEVKQEMVDMQMAAHKNQQRVIAHKERLIDKFKAKAGKAKFAKSLQSEIKRMDIVELDTHVDKSMRIGFTPGVRVGRIAYETQKLDKAYGPKSIISGLDIKIERGERIAFVGQNGQGKTTLARILAGKLEASGGEVIIGHNVQLGYYAQDQTERLDRKKTILETLAQHAPGETIGRQRSILGAFLFEGDEVGKKVSVLSGGERARLSFACMVVDPTNVLILDEPTNHLDIASKEILKQTLQRFEGTLIIVSHDMDFLSGLTTHTLEFRNRVIKKHLYGIDEFLSNRQMESLRDLEKETKVAQAPKAARESAQTHKTVDQKLERQVKKLEQQIEKLEKKKEALTAEMSADGFYDTASSSKVLSDFQSLSDKLQACMEEWEELAERL